MLYKAKHNLTVGRADRSTVVYEANKLYKASEIDKDVDFDNFIQMTEGDVAREQVAKKPSANIVKGDAPKGDIE